MIADLYCGAGLASDGYGAIFGAAELAGWDIEPQPHYPYAFHRADALDVLSDIDGPLTEARAIHASPPCQLFTTAGRLRDAQGGASSSLDLLTPTLELLRGLWGHVPWVVENVADNRGLTRRIMAPREGESLIMLCGSMFGLGVQRHRLFLANLPLRKPTPTGPGVWGALGCRHHTFPADPITGRPRPWGVYHVSGDSIPSGGRTARDKAHAAEVMGTHRALPWEALKEGIPPAYATWVGADILGVLTLGDRMCLDTPTKPGRQPQ